MGNTNDKVNVNIGLANDGLGLTLQTMFKGMETLLQSKSVVGEPFVVGNATIVPLLEISAGLASGALQNNAHNNGAGAMSAKAAPVAMLIIQEDKVRLVNVKNQDIFTRLIDLIPEAIDKIKKGAVSGSAKEAAEKMLDDMADMDEDDIKEVEIIEPEK